RRHLPAGHARPVVAGEHANGLGRVLLPRQVDRPGGEVVRPRQVEERRQERLLADLPGGDDLRDVERVQLRPAGRRLARQVDVGEGRVGRPEVDSDEVAGHRRTLYLPGYYATHDFRA